MFSEFMKTFKKLCKPSQFYLFISLTSIVVMLMQNLSDSSKYCVGDFECDLPYHNIFVFLSKIAYIIVWTIIFDSLCKNGYKSLAWAIILVPVMLMFALIGLLFFVGPVAVSAAN